MTLHRLLANTLPANAPPKRSLWRHRKTGNIYEVERVARDSANPFLWDVVYRCVWHGNPFAATSALGQGTFLGSDEIPWTRKLSEWEQEVEEEGLERGPRFVRLSAEEERKVRRADNQVWPPRDTWGIVSFIPIETVRWASDLIVTRIYAADEYAKPGEPWECSALWDKAARTHKKVPHAHIVQRYGNTYRIVPPTHYLPGGPWHLRQAAREAKAAFVKEKKLTRQSFGEIIGSDGPDYAYPY